MQKNSDKLIDKKVPRTGRFYSGPNPGICYPPWQTVRTVASDHPNEQNHTTK